MRAIFSVVAALAVGLIGIAGQPAKAANVKVTPLGLAKGEFCPFDQGCHRDEAMPGREDIDEPTCYSIVAHDIIAGHATHVEIVVRAESYARIWRIHKAAAGRVRALPQLSPYLQEPRSRSGVFVCAGNNPLRESESGL